MTTIQRAELRHLLEKWRDGELTPEGVISTARERWLAGDASTEDPIASDVLLVLAMGAEEGITHEDVPALLEWLETPPGEEPDGLERFGNYILGLDASAREKIAGTEYYGAAAAFKADLDFAYRTPADRAIHRAVREEPETIWEHLRDALCAPRLSGDREMFWADILEDLIVYHEDQFIDRLEALARDCPEARQQLAGVAEQVGERFARLQEQLRRDLDLTR